MSHQLIARSRCIASFQS